jgi:ribosome-associated heat shock protein Hsp15
MPESRLDKWLWVARFYKTRALAAAAIDGGKIERNGEKAKRGKPVRPGDTLRIRLGPYEHRVTVLGVATQRGSASIAAQLYEEEPESRAARERIHEQHRLAATLHGGAEKGRPTKRDRREIQRLKEGGD